MHKLPRTIQTLAKREATLRALLGKGASAAKLISAADRVRNARIHVLRAKIGEIPSVIRGPEHERRIAKLGRQIESLRATTPRDILAEFQQQELFHDGRGDSQLHVHENER